ncbi:decarboxylating NADP(+)-dependent phosphogluconate dehydrogenase [Borrelia miyamotoi]|uniref:6-phosphogluconate dehydrogenase, decarboxylating n=1 Tax=Borrelia miyamotoi TaxID=47466 RepID=A0AAQ3AFW2_9SPIR|nr:decarboxylating NADP(+)-dependent phosphogluconate dehydrogenase [Borrelia miyamotoi]AGT27517.1 6-phosphogluconate dehydrogenase [Borrelia miyamotoi LB-2001]AJA58698.1 6-phosphogluconate dehydrogenase [Borrelia miyamotoi]AOW95776.1 phosphogluconate dehydrogenase (NADP(+)-dependent, decarboxylating) [Borrelia miyamotoi]QTL83665.1 decarboxylating NADP(+)-dependent phosphogluconate dehydrogenase [Borrelia miyamotoi]WAZ85033.1 decarboxylating NADP(+)-dependent phosphogluconate dehydrogenase [Bo
MDVGIYGLGVMGSNLALNIADNGFNVSVYNRDNDKTEIFLTSNAHKKINGFKDIKTFIGSLKKPRKIILMISSSAIDEVTEQILPLVEKFDIIIDGGNSHYKDTMRREQELSSKDIYFIGLGMSGGENGARSGPSLMYGGSKKIYELIEPLLNKIAAKTSSGDICSAYVGENGAGHYVKMVHNGIEYADMQLIGEAYFFMKRAFNLDNLRISEVFEKWGEGDLSSYLMEITSKILRYKENNEYLLDKILDVANQKGTGKWLSIEAFQFNVPANLIFESVFARFLSGLKHERVIASDILKMDVDFIKFDLSDWILDLYYALLVSKILAYAQGFMMLKVASVNYAWDLNLGKISLIWREGCIIKSVFLDKIKLAYDKNPHLINLLFDDYFLDIIKKHHKSLRRVVSKASEIGIPLPVFYASLSFLDSYSTNYLPANLIQAQRDFFGSHSFERIDSKRGEFFHSTWE